jgi:DNA invertase Pin-like site-specific DNA recombinase
MKDKRAALYLRVSTADQTVNNQRVELEAAAAARGWTVAATYADEAFLVLSSTFRISGGET